VQDWLPVGDAMKNFSNELTPAQAEALALLAEECGEVVQIVGKILRHGLYSYHPNDPGVSNAMHLEHEIADVRAAIEILIRDRVVLEDSIDRWMKRKIEKFRDPRNAHLLHHVEPL
jgi:hypothetical protein